MSGSGSCGKRSRIPDSRQHRDIETLSADGRQYFFDPRRPRQLDDVERCVGFKFQQLAERIQSRPDPANRVDQANLLGRGAAPNPPRATRSICPASKSRASATFFVKSS